MRLRWLTRSVFMTLWLLVAAAIGADSTAAGEFVREFAFEADELSVVNLIGEIRLAPARGDRFEVRIEVQGKDADSDLIAIKTAEGRQASLEVSFPIASHHDYVYPRLGRGSTRISPPGLKEDQATNWLERLLRQLGRQRIAIRGSGRGLEVWADVTIMVPGGRAAEVWLGAGAIEANRVEAELALRISRGDAVIADHRGPALDVDTGSGSVTIDGTMAARLHVDTGSGSVTINRARAERLLVDTGSGSVAIGAAETGHLHVDTGSGSIMAHAIGADSARLDTGSGAIVLELDRLGQGPFVIDTGSGGVRLGLPAEASATITVATGSGGIRADVPGAEIVKQSRDELHLRVGGGAARVSVDTGSGGVTITGR